MTNLIIIAKECLPGRVKTRLHPPLSLEQAATLAAASLADTFEAAGALDADRRILLFDGVHAPHAASAYEVIDQVEGDLDERLAAIFDEVDGPTVLIGMDTPQLDSRMLAPVFNGWPSDVDAFLGFADDGGFWALGMKEPDGSLIRGVPMSRDDTGQVQLQRLVSAGLNVVTLPTLTDVDTIDDAIEVAALIPGSRFAAAFASFDLFAVSAGAAA